MTRDFQGKIELDVRDSTPDWDAFLPGKAAEGAPNVLVVLYDDTGQAAWSPYGGRINMPTLDRLADERADLHRSGTRPRCARRRGRRFLTGRNHHLNGFASISESSTGFPGYSSHIPPENAHDGERAARRRLEHVLGRQEPQHPDRRVDRWAHRRRSGRSGQGYDRFYGFIGGETNHWYPVARRGQPLHRPAVPARGRLPPVEGPRRQGAPDSSATRSRPSPTSPGTCGSARAPTTPRTTRPQEYIDKYKGMFDDGYEAYREWVLPRMIERGILPEGTELTPINPMADGTFADGDCVRPWDELTDEEKRAVQPHGRGLRRLLASTPTRRSAGSSTTSRSRASSRTRSSSTAPTTAPRARAARTARSTRASSSTATPTRSRRTCR